MEYDFFARTPYIIWKLHKEMQHYSKENFFKFETLGKTLFIYFSQHSSRCGMQDKCNFQFQTTPFLDIWCLMLLNISVSIDQNI
jgi:hypothetical protein